MKPTYIEVSAEVRYWEDAEINGVKDTQGTLTPFRKGDNWCPVIRLADGVLMDWPAGVEAFFHFKVCDAGEYWLLDGNRQRVAKWGGCYVPDEFLCPASNGYGDYIIMQVDTEGGINKWRTGGPEIAYEGDDDDERGWKRLAPSIQPPTPERKAAAQKTLPPLPPMLAAYNPTSNGDRAQLYTSDQMRAYGEECAEWGRSRASMAA